MGMMRGKRKRRSNSANVKFSLTQKRRRAENKRMRRRSGQQNFVSNRKGGEKKAGLRSAWPQGAAARQEQGGEQALGRQNQNRATPILEAQPN